MAIGRACGAARTTPPAAGAGFAPKSGEGGFEPPSDPKARNGFRDRRIRPLCHPSARDATMPPARPWPVPDGGIGPGRNVASGAAEKDPDDHDDDPAEGHLKKRQAQ